MSEKKNGGTYDTIIVGAGLGGLFAGAKLTREGKRVLLLEKHSVVGGFATSFKRGRFTFEAGLHEVDGFFDPDNPNLDFFRELGVLDNIDFLRVPEFYKVVRGDMSFTVPDDIELCKEALHRSFPDDKVEANRLLKTLADIRRQALAFPQTRGKMLLHLLVAPFKYRSLFRYLRSTAGDYLDDLTDNDDLKIVMTANTAYYNDDPFNHSMIHFCGAQGSFMIGGGAYIRGGSQNLSNFMAQQIRNGGGEILLGTTADKIVLDDGAVRGVEYRKNGNPESIRVSTDFVVANNAIPNVVNNLLNGQTPAKVINKYRDFKLSHSIFAVYYGLKAPAAQVGLDSYSTFVLPEGLTEFRDMAKYNMTPDFNEKIVAIVNYDMVDSSLGDAENHTVVCTVVDRIHSWEDLDKERYKERKMAMADILTARIDARFPGFADLVEIREVATPRTMRRYTGNPEGAVYGYEQSTSQFGPKRPDWFSGVPGLYYASAWTKPGGGMTPASKAGYMAARMILDKMN